MKTKTLPRNEKVVVRNLAFFSSGSFFCLPLVSPVRLFTKE